MLKPAPGLRTLTTKPDDQRESGDDFEVEQRLAADAAELLQIAHRGDAVDDGAEDDRRDDHLDQLDEAVAERLERFAELRKEMADDDAERDGDQHLDVENPIPCGATRTNDSCQWLRLYGNRCAG